MHRPSLPDSMRTRVISLGSVAGGVAALVVAGALVSNSSAAYQPAAPATPSLPATVGASVAPERTLPPVIVIEKPTPIPAAVAPTLPLGVLASTPVRVHTGDGDCLNVRPAAGMQAGADPRFCVPEGHGLWLYGDPVIADGETWRYALGTGWVAVRYTDPAPELAAERLPGVFDSVVIYGNPYNGTDGIPAARVSLSTGATTTFMPVPYTPQGIGARPPYTSPDGTYGAYATWGTTPTLTIRTLADGSDVSIPGAYPVEWAPDGKLLVNIGDCAEGCKYQPGWIEPGSHTLHRLGQDNTSGASLAWAADYHSVFYAPYPSNGKNGGMPVQRLWLDGRIETVLAALPDGVYAGELTVSPDGNSLLLGSAAGTIRTLDIATGVLHEFARAPQLPVGGRCGGASGKLSGWLDSAHIIYHESYAAKGSNGITIGDLRDGSRRVLPYWSIQELTVVAPDTVSFSTWEGIGDLSFQVSWLLDSESGEARPVAVGSAPTWIAR